LVPARQPQHTAACFATAHSDTHTRHMRPAALYATKHVLNTHQQQGVRHVPQRGQELGRVWWQERERERLQAVSGNQMQRPCVREALLTHQASHNTHVRHSHTFKNWCELHSACCRIATPPVSSLGAPGIRGGGAASWSCGTSGLHREPSE
jgi:hypothetical protein